MQTDSTTPAQARRQLSVELEQLVELCDRPEAREALERIRSLVEVLVDPLASARSRGRPRGANKLMQATVAVRHPLLRYRIAYDLSQAQLAERVGEAQSTVSRWESTRYMPSPARIIMMADALGLDGDQLTADWQAWLEAMQAARQLEVPD